MGIGDVVDVVGNILGRNRALGNVVAVGNGASCGILNSFERAIQVIDEAKILGGSIVAAPVPCPLKNGTAHYVVAGGRGYSVGLVGGQVIIDCSHPANGVLNIDPPLIALVINVNNPATTGICFCGKPVQLVIGVRGSHRS